MNEKFLQNGIMIPNRLFQLIDLTESDLAQIINYRIPVRIATTQIITNTMDFNGAMQVAGVEMEFGRPAFVANKEIIASVLAMSFTGSNDLKSRFDTFLVLVFAVGGRIFFTNSATNDVDCEIRVEF